VKQRTYWHLQGQTRRPSDYDIGTSRLLYYPGRGFEVKTPVAAFHSKHATALRCNDWEAFRDPRETTYTKYTELQKNKEIFVDGVLESFDAPLDPAWVATLERIFAPLRFPVHGLQMVSAYFGHMAPSGRIVCAAAFQCGDEMRRIQRIAYRMRQIAMQSAGFGDASKRTWEKAEMWQPLREAVERLLVTYDWGEALFALDLVLKPAFDELFMVQLARLARAAGDDVLAQVLGSLNEDCAWHKAWSQALLRMLVQDVPGNVALLRGWMDKWQPRAKAALAPFESTFGEGTAANVTRGLFDPLELARA
jgi:toluene monooxygenase system protein E